MSLRQPSISTCHWSGSCYRTARWSVADGRSETGSGVRVFYCGRDQSRISRTTPCTLHSLFAGAADVPGRGCAASRPGPCATTACEPRQGRKAAALSRPCSVPQVHRVAVGRTRSTPNLHSQLPHPSYSEGVEGVGSWTLDVGRWESSVPYQVIARKYRPQRFDDVVGQEVVTRTLRNAIASGRIAHAFVFAGSRGWGKTTTARILARAVNCVKGPTPDPCGECDACVEIAQGRDLDVLEIDAASHTGIDNIREVVISGLSITPVRDRYKIFIIDEVHQLSTPSFNALLKSIEEPPAHVLFIMATTELHKRSEE